MMLTEVAELVKTGGLCLVKGAICKNFSIKKFKKLIECINVKK